MSTRTIAVGGENLVDFVETGTGDGIPQYAANPGGGPFNIAIAAARQGCDVDYLTPVSQDRLGQLIAARLDESGVKLATSMVSAPSSLAVVSLDNGQPNYQFYRNGTAERGISSADLTAYFAAPCWAFHIGSLALADGKDAEIWEDQFIACHENGVITSLDPNIRPALIADRETYLRRINRMLPHADIIKLSDEDMAWLFPDTPLENALDHLAAIAGDALIVLTMGGDGAKACSTAATAQCAAHPVRSLIDTVGAGDTFMASMLAWLKDNAINLRHDIVTLDRTGLEAMLQRAAHAAALTCQRQGCNPPDLQDLQRDGKP